MTRLLFLFTYLIFLIACNPSIETGTNPKFESLTSNATGVDFQNKIIENDTLNYYTFPYLYMGGGVSIGDINNDGLSDIYFTGNLTSNKLYLNEGNMQFEDITASASIGGDHRWYTGTTMVDINNDGYLDIYLCVAGKFAITKNQLFINNKDNTFSERAEEYGLDDSSASIQSTFFDYDNDGDLDVYVANYPIVPVSMGNAFYHLKMKENDFIESAHLFKNNGNHSFTDVTTEAGVQNFGLSLGIVASDFNNDGWKDLYVSNDFNVPDYFYINNQDGTFRETIQEATNHTAMFGMGIDASDFNNDGLTDFIQVDMTPNDHKKSKTNMASMRPKSFWEAIDMGFHYQYMQNTLQVNNGSFDGKNPSFSDISRLAGVATTDWSWGAMFADLDNDGWKDIFITNGMKRDVNNNDVNNQMKSQSFFGGEKDYTLLPSQPVENFAFKNNKDFTFISSADQWGLKFKGFSNGAAYSDLDNDGDLDLVVNNLDSPASIYKNQIDQQDHGYLKVKLNGPEQNPNGLGAKVKITAPDNSIQIQELTLTRGFQSSVDPIIHFGLGKKESKIVLEIIWPDGKTQILKEVDSNQLLALNHQDAKTTEVLSTPIAQHFENITKDSEIDFLHMEDDYDDFSIEPLLPHKNSQYGPALASGDINGDGLEDFFIGNAHGSAAQMYVQNMDETFKVINGPWEENSDYEDTGATLFDADNDGDLDLYVVHGGNEPSKSLELYQDHLYINTSNGFQHATEALPIITNSGLKVAPADFDNDGDMDLFVGGRIVPGQYPSPAASYLLRNMGGVDQNIKFENATKEMAPELENAGLVTDALWSDFSGDGLQDLIISGEWMPIKFFINTKNAFEEVTNQTGLADKIGWWYSLNATDIDLDGDMDYVAGNLGLNYKYRASPSSPFEIYSNDFDENRKLDIVLSFEKDGTRYPVRGRECSSEQVPAIKQRFETYNEFANATLDDIYGEHILDQSLKYSATTFAHKWIENKSDGTFVMHDLPNRSQFSSINKILTFDYNGDVYPDLLLAGNLFTSEVETPRNDGSVGLILTGSSTGDFEVIPPHISGLYLQGDIRGLSFIKIGKTKKGLLVAANDDKLRLLSVKPDVTKSSTENTAFLKTN
ncbi:MAG: VCBS repeat-containing protein [Cyclobacteriaceae bacterium]